MTYWYATLIILMITLARFFFICVWKRMRHMKDDLLARITLNLAVFLGLFFTLTVIRPAPSRSHAICTGIFDDENDMSSSMSHPYTTIIFSCAIVIVILMVMIKVYCFDFHQSNQSNQSASGISPPKNLDSLFLNFSLVVIIYVLGIMPSHYMKKFVYFTSILKSTIHKNIVSIIIQKLRKSC